VRPPYWAQDSLEKVVQAPKKAKTGKPVRLLQADWADICAHVAGDVDRLGAGRLIAPGDEPAPSVAFLMASTSEVESRASMRPALELHRALEDRGLRVYNPRNKTAGRPGSPVHDLMALVSYLIDPVTMAPAGKNGRMIEVWASDPRPVTVRRNRTTQVPDLPGAREHSEALHQGYRPHRSAGTGGRLAAGVHRRDP
jgi:hypothetical protein